MFKTTYIADGSTRKYSFAFPFFQNADVRIAINDVALENNAYSVTPNSNFDGGFVTLKNAPADKSRIDIFRCVALTRPIDYQSTVHIDAEHLNADFNFLLAAIQDIEPLKYDLANWQNSYDNMLATFKNISTLIDDKLTGGGALGIYNNLVSVLQNALPTLINDYGSITQAAPNENRDDYGVL